MAPVATRSTCGKGEGVHKREGGTLEEDYPVPLGDKRVADGMKKKIRDRANRDSRGKNS